MNELVGHGTCTVCGVTQVSAGDSECEDCQASAVAGPRRRYKLFATFGGIAAASPLFVALTPTGITIPGALSSMNAVTVFGGGLGLLGGLLALLMSVRVRGKSKVGRILGAIGIVALAAVDLAFGFSGG